MAFNQYFIAVAGVGVLTAVCWPLTPFTGHAAIGLIYLLGVLVAGIILNRGPVLFVATLSALAWNFLFIPPLFTFHIADVHDALMFLTYFVVAIIIGSLTTRLRAREQIAARVSLAEETERLRKTLLDCVSHELKTPIAAISAASQQLQQSASATNQELSRELAGEIQRASARLNRVVNHLLDITRLESGVIKPRTEWCDVRELLQLAIQTESEALANRAVNIDVSGELPLVLLDHSLIVQAIGKLLANAATHTAPNLPVEITARFSNEQLVISVDDHGPGLKAESFDRLFEKFYHADGGNASRGLGLGLSIARGFVEAHGGNLLAKNRQGGGATFSIILPVETRDRRSLDPTS